MTETICDPVATCVECLSGGKEAVKQAILLLDAECSPCSEFGKRIQDEGLTEGSILEVGSLHDERYKEYVGMMEPTLLYLDGDSARTSTGMRLAIDLVKIVGMRRAYRIAVLARNATSDSKFDPSRRSFLIKAASAAAILPLAPMLGDLPPRRTPSSPLTAAEAKRAYTLLRASGKFETAHRKAKRDGVRHRRDTSALRTEPGIEGFVADTYHVVLAGAVGSRRLLQFTLAYEDEQGERVTGRWMSVLVDIGHNKVLSALDVDAREVDEGTVTPGSTSTRSHGEAKIAAEVQRRSGNSDLPAGRLRIQGAGVDATLNNGVWSGTAPQRSVSTRHHEEVVCAQVALVQCTVICRFLVYFGLIGATVCGLTCATVWIWTCWLADV